MKLKTTLLSTKQGDFIQVTEQTANFCKRNNITLAKSETSCAHNQRLEILELLEQLPGLTTFEFRELNYATVNPRLLELRERYHIITQRVDIEKPDGIVHKRVGRYALVGEKEIAA